MELSLLLPLHVLLIVTTLLIQHRDAHVIRQRDVGPQETPTTVQATTDAPHEYGAGSQVFSEHDFNKHWQNVVGDKENTYKWMEVNSFDFDKLSSNFNQKQEDEVDTKTEIKEDTVKEEFAKKDLVDTEVKEVAGKVTPADANSKGVVENDTVKEIRIENNIVKDVETEMMKEKNAKDTTGGKENELKEISQGSKVIKDHEEEQTVKEERKEKDTLKEKSETINTENNNEISEGSKVTKEQEEEKLVTEEREEKDVVKEESEEKINTGAPGKMAKADNKEKEEDDLVTEKLENVDVVKEEATEGDKVSTINKVEQADNIVKEKEEDDFVTEKLENVDVVKEEATEGDKVSTINKVEHTKEDEETRVEDTETKVSQTEGVKTSEAKPSDPNVDQRSKPQEKVTQGEGQSEGVIPVGLVTVGYNDDTDKPAGVGQIIITTATLPDVDSKAPASRKNREARIETPRSKVMYPPSWGRSYFDVDRIPPPGWRANVVGYEGPTYKPTSRMLFGALPPNKQWYNYPNQPNMSALQGQRVMNNLFPQSLPASSAGLEKTLVEKDPSSGDSKDVAQGISTTADKESSPQAVEAATENTSLKVQPSETKGDDKVDVDQKLEAQSSSLYLNSDPDVDEYSRQSTYFPEASQPRFPSFPSGALIYPVFVPIPVYPLPPPGYRAQSGIPPPLPKPLFPFAPPRYQQP